MPLVLNEQITSACTRIRRTRKLGRQFRERNCKLWDFFERKSSIYRSRLGKGIAIGRPLVNSASHWFITDRKRRVWGRGGARDGENVEVYRGTRREGEMSSSREGGRTEWLQEWQNATLTARPRRSVTWLRANRVARGTSMFPSRDFDVWLQITFPDRLLEDYPCLATRRRSSGIRRDSRRAQSWSIVSSRSTRIVCHDALNCHDWSWRF